MIVAFKRGKELNMTDQENEGSRTKQRDLYSIIPSTPDHCELPALSSVPGPLFPVAPLKRCKGPRHNEDHGREHGGRSAGPGIHHRPGTSRTDTFVFILFVVTIGILGGNIFNVFFLKAYDKKVESIKNSNAKLVPIITTAMFLGLYGTMAAPHFTNIANIPAVAAILVAGITSIFVNKFAANHKKLKEFAFPLSMIVGMLGACVANLLI